MTSLSQAEFAVLLRRAGLALSEAEIGDLYENGFLPFEAMAANVRGGGMRPREAEPAHVFRVDDAA
jgi:hypothetical protein